ncbi:mechanosensitive ion channel family protein [Alloprevotella rava]|uniref:Small conductance mechanosensitive channel n=1 Tax=Alloprevotella rava TaxID=671218 RepID=A0A7W5Y250_9BACT|nr:mechanosensitive ion channel family protein [Alloprevotella rava]MBB3703390.1 small conductance mechanosensitive channel [Alloprevotella rava]
MFSILSIASSEINISQFDHFLQRLIEMGIGVGKNILAAIVVYIVGRWIVKLLNKVVASFLLRSKVEPTVQTFLKSLTNILLTILLLITVASTLGVNTTSFAALLASAGVAIGMALSGNLQNFAGGLVILLFKPYKVGDTIEAQSNIGVVRAIQIFHTIIETADGRRVYIPNGTMSTTLVINSDQTALRREIWTVGIEYGNDVEHAREVIINCLKQDPAILTEPKDMQGNALDPYFVQVANLSASSVELTVRAYVLPRDYWAVRFRMQETFYKAINEDPKLNIPFNTQTLYVVNDDKVTTKGGDKT